MIDVHHHFLPIELVDDIERHVPDHVEVIRDDDLVTLRDRVSGLAYLRLDPSVWCDPERQLADMDEAGVRRSILSTACYQDWITMDAARICNDGIAEVVKAYPDRFSGMVSVPPDGGGAMAEELRRGVLDLGLCGVNITTNFKGRYPDDPSFRQLFVTANELDVPVFIHPSWHPPSLDHLESWGLERTLGKGSDLCLAIARLVYSGVLAELTSLRVVVAHLGGVLPITHRRMFEGPEGWLDTPDQDYAEIFGRVWVDTAPGIWQSPTEIAFAAQVLGSSQVMFGSDYPLSNSPAGILQSAVAHVMALEMVEEEREGIASRNASICFRVGE